MSSPASPPPSTPPRPPLPVRRVARVAAAAAALAAALALAGCGGSRPLAQVGSRTITLAEAERVARGNDLQYPGVPDLARSMFLDDLVRRALMLEYAHRQGFDTTAFAHNTRRDLEDRLLLQTLYARLAPTDPGVSAAEVERLHQWRGQQADVKLVYTLDEPRIRLAKADLDAGQPFAAVSSRYSIAGMLPPGGALGWIMPGALVAPLDEALRTLPVGRVGGPYGTPLGWFLLRVDARRAHPEPPLVQEAAGLEQLLRQRKQRATLGRALADLKEEYDLRLVPGGSQVLFHYLSPYDSAGTPTPDVRRGLLARWNGGTYTLGEAFADLRRQDVEPPPPMNLAAMDTWIEVMAMRRVGLAEARRRHLDEDPAVAERVRDGYEGQVLQVVYTLATQAVPPASDSLVQALWAQDRGQYQRLDGIHVLTFDGDSATTTALSLHAHVGLRAAVRMSGRDTAAVRETRLRFPTKDPQWLQVEAMFLQLRPGDVTGPVKLPGGTWRLYQLLDKDQGVQSWENLPPAIQQNFRSSAYELERERRFRQFTDSLRTAYRPRLFAANLRRLPWPVR